MSLERLFFLAQSTTAHVKIVMVIHIYLADVEQAMKPVIHVMAVVMLLVLDVMAMDRNWLTAVVVEEEAPLYVAVVEVAVGR